MSQFSTMVKGAIAGDLLAMLLGPTAAEPFTSHVHGLDEWVAQMMTAGEQGDDPVNPPDARPLVALANSMLT